MESIIVLVGVQVGYKDEDFLPTTAQAPPGDVVVTQEPIVKVERGEEKQSTTLQEVIYDIAAT